MKVMGLGPLRRFWRDSIDGDQLLATLTCTDGTSYSLVANDPYHLHSSTNTAFAALTKVIITWGTDGGAARPSQTIE